MITSNAFYVVLTPSTHGDFIACVSLLRSYGGMDKVPIYLCCWHVLQTWCLRGTKKIKDVEVRGGILQDLHDVMYMPINHGKKFMTSKNIGGLL